MKEKELHPKTPDYLYNELSPEERQAHEALIEKNWDLRTETHELKHVLETLRESERLSPPPAFPESRTQRIMHAARAREFTVEKRKFFFLSWFLKPAFAYAVTLLSVSTLAFYISKERVVPSPKQTLSMSFAHDEAKSEAAAPVLLVEKKQLIRPKLRADSKNIAAVASQERTAVTVQNVSTGGALAPRPAAKSSFRRAMLEQQLADSLSVNDQLTAAQESLDRKEWNVALKYFHNVANLAPGTFEAMFALHESAKVYETLGKRAMALDLYDHLLSRYPNYRHRDQALFESGKLYLQENNLEKAQENFQTCYDLYPAMRSALAPYLQPEQAADAAGKSIP